MIAIVLSTLALAVAYGSAWLPGGAPAWASWLFVLGIAGLMVSMMWLGARRPGRGVGRLVLPFAFVFLVLVGGFGLVLLLPPADPAAPVLWLGLPPRAAIVLYGIGLLPVLVLPVAYAMTFDELTLSEADLERVRAARRAMDAQHGGPQRAADAA